MNPIKKKPLVCLLICLFVYLLLFSALRCPYRSALLPLASSLPENSSCRADAMAFILLVHIESKDGVDEEIPTSYNNDNDN